MVWIHYEELELEFEQAYDSVSQSNGTRPLRIIWKA